MKEVEPFFSFNPRSAAARDGKQGFRGLPGKAEHEATDCRDIGMSLLSSRDFWETPKPSSGHWTSIESEVNRME